MRFLSIGDIVWYHRDKPSDPVAAIVTKVRNDTLVTRADLTIFPGGSGPSENLGSIPLSGSPAAGHFTARDRQRESSEIGAGAVAEPAPAPSGIGTSPASTSAVAAFAGELEEGAPLADSITAPPGMGGASSAKVALPADPIWRATGANQPCWPVGLYQGLKPVISDGFSRLARKDPVSGKQLERQHLGVDICFKGDTAAKPNLPENTRWYFCPSHTIPMRAALAGTIWFAGKTPTGWTIEIDHGMTYGFPLVTYYTHMSALAEDLRKGDRVIPGALLGFVGNSPASEDDVNHCHFEMWEYTRGNRPRQERCLDPEPYLKTWRILGATT